MTKSSAIFRAVVLMLAAFYCLPVGAQNYDQADLDRALDLTIKEAANEAASQLKGLTVDGTMNIAILPLWGEGNKDYIAQSVKAALAGGPFRVMERNTEDWNSLLSEIEWRDKRADIMNPDTIKSFGRIEGCQGVIYGTVRESGADSNKQMAITRLILFLGDVETGEVMWSSQEIVKTKPLTGDITPDQPVVLNPALVKAIQKAAQQALADLESKSLSIKNFAVLPFWGNDPGRAITDTVQGQLAGSAYKPIPTSSGEWQTFLNEIKWTQLNADTMDSTKMCAFAKDKGCDAILYGTVHEARVDKNKYQVFVRLSFYLMDANSGEILWSPAPDLLTVSGPLDTFDIVDNAQNDKRVWIIGGVIGGIVVLLILKGMMKSVMTPR